MAQPTGPQPTLPQTGRNHLIAAVDAFSQSLAPDERVTLNQTETPGDILELTKALQDARVPVNRINRCEAFLQSVQQFSNIVDTMIQHNAFISALVWGSVKILLLTAQNFTQYFSALTKLLERVGKICPVFKEFQDVWPYHLGLQDAVFEYFAKTVEFCTRALAFLRRSSTSMIIKALFQRVTSELQDVEKELTFQQEIVQYQLILAREDAATRARQQQVLFNTTLKQDLEQEWAESRVLKRRLVAATGRNEHQLQKLTKDTGELLYSKQREQAEKKAKARRNLLGRISNYNHTKTFLDISNISHARTGEWLYEMDEYKHWVESPQSSLLWCYGIPGSGKSVLSTAVVKHLLDTCFQQPTSGPRKTFISYFFCTFNEQRSLKFEELVRSLIKQVLFVFHGTAEFEEYLATFLDKYNNIPSTDAWQDLLIRSLGIPNDTYIILDGVDECDGDFQARVLLLKNKLLNMPRRVKIYLSSRKDVYLARNITPSFSISLDDIGSRPEIEGYIDLSLKQRYDDGRLRVQDPAMIQEIKHALMVGVDGM
ncbi:hypothetical protein BDZ91DRAFT_297131 [Kalaharituber pfeilii]|nr:hypothetical protein BDZ91DRAFT_297131 [Kalaharituber pfeilii]